MENKGKILDNALDQLIQQSLYKLEQSDQSVKESSIKISTLYDSLLLDDTLENSVQERVSFYVKESIEATNKELRHIYLQGAKDCITAIRMLGVIK